MERIVEAESLPICTYFCWDCGDEWEMKVGCRLRKGVEVRLRLRKGEVRSVVHTLRLRRLDRLERSETDEVRFKKGRRPITIRQVVWRAVRDFNVIVCERSARDGWIDSAE